MDTISLADAKARFSELIDRASEGETIQITRRGRPVAQITPVERPRKTIDIELLRSVNRMSPMQSESAGDFIRRMRDEDRY